MNAGASWWPLTRKVRQALAWFVTTEAAAVAGELATGTPGWSVVAGGAIIGGGAVLVAYLTQDESSPP